MSKLFKEIQSEKMIRVTYELSDDTVTLEDIEGNKISMDLKEFSELVSEIGIELLKKSDRVLDRMNALKHRYFKNLKRVCEKRLKIKLPEDIGILWLERFAEINGINTKEIWKKYADEWNKLFDKFKETIDNIDRLNEFRHKGE